MDRPETRPYACPRAGPKEQGSPVVERAIGYRAALRDAGLRATSADVVVCPYGAPIDARFEAARTLLVGRLGVSAAVACTDESAFALLRAAADLGRRVPDDLAVVTIDGTQSCEASVPSLSAAATDFAATAANAMESIAETVGASEQIDIPMTFERRESCGCIPSAEVTPHARKGSRQVFVE